MGSRMEMFEPYVTGILWFKKLPDTKAVADAFEARDKKKKHDWTTNHMKHLQSFDHHQCRYGPTNMDHGVSFVENSEVVDAFKCVSHSFLFVMRSLNSFRRVGTPENQRFFMILTTMKIRQNRSDTPGFFGAFNVKGWLEAASVSLIHSVTMCHRIHWVVIIQAAGLIQKWRVFKDCFEMASGNI